jgi:hypothetical protein
MTRRRAGPRGGFLRDAVDGQLRLVGQRRQAIWEPALDADAALVREPARKLGEGADQAEVLEHLRAQLARDPPHLLERLAHGARSLDGATLLGVTAAGERVELEQHSGQNLSDLVVQAPGDARPVPTPGAECLLAAHPALGLEPLQHLVEDAHELGDLGAAPLGEPLVRPEQVDRSHSLDEPLDRAEGCAAGARSSPEHDHEDDGHVDPRGTRRIRGSAAGKREQERRDHEQGGVDREDPPKQWEA